MVLLFPTVYSKFRIYLEQKENIQFKINRAYDFIQTSNIHSISFMVWFFLFVAKRGINLCTPSARISSCCCKDSIFTLYKQNIMYNDISFLIKKLLKNFSPNFFSQTKFQKHVLKISSRRLVGFFDFNDLDLVIWV